ncbi:MAG: hypothetical protein GC136_07460 [Alphaproteobacteria bacterium]|nr:hypothetical protein [Alphaproteobacteria bacterium]
MLAWMMIDREGSICINYCDDDADKQIPVSFKYDAKGQALFLSLADGSQKCICSKVTSRIEDCIVKADEILLKTIAVNQTTACDYKLLPLERAYGTLH